MKDNPRTRRKPTKGVREGRPYLRLPKDNSTNIRERYYKTGKKSLTEANVKELLSVITDIEHLALIELALTAGIRRNDIIKIRQRDFDFEKRKITFYEHKKNRSHTVYIPPNTANTLQMVVGSNKKEIYLFPGTSEKKAGKGHISSKSAYNILQRYLQKAGLDKRPFHALRATCIKLCQKRGWKPEEIGELTGDSLKVIQKHYSVPSDDDMRETTKEKPIL